MVLESNEIMLLVVGRDRDVLFGTSIAVCGNKPFGLETYSYRAMGNIPQDLVQSTVIAIESPVEVSV
jgi:hypothetical protein